MDQILITGGSGKTGRRLAERLQGQARLASRKASGANAVAFDWTDPDTFDAALDGVGSVYLVAPTRNGDQLTAMTPFLRRALAAGIGRFVLLSASLLEDGGPLMGHVHAFLRSEASQWAVLRPSWFMQDFTEGYHGPDIREDGVIYSATGDGRVGFIDAEDIASVAAALLVAPTMPNAGFVLTGPEAVTYDEAARLISDATGRRIEHRRISEAELTERWHATGLPDEHARTLAAMDRQIAGGADDRVTDAVLTLTGQPPRALERFVAEQAARGAFN